MRYTKNCYQTCINKKFLIPNQLWKDCERIVTKLPLNATTGRPRLDIKRGINGIYYLLKTGVHWNALPRCFGSSSAVHRLLQDLAELGFFKELWTDEINHYNQIHGLNLEKVALDCAHKKSPIAGSEKTGKSPVDRRKLGSKISAISESKGVIIGLAIGASNQHDSTLFLETLLSIPQSLKQPYYKEMHLDSAYDSENVRTILFNWSYVPKIAPNKRRKAVRPPNPLGYCRWFIEPVHAWMNKFRSIYVRYCKKVKNYLALSQFAAATINFNKIRV
jgi:putative transposase